MSNALLVLRFAVTSDAEIGELIALVRDRFVVGVDNDEQVAARSSWSMCIHRHCFLLQTEIAKLRAVDDNDEDEDEDAMGSFEELDDPHAARDAEDDKSENDAAAAAEGDGDERAALAAKKLAQKAAFDRVSVVEQCVVCRTC